jgi:ABC-type nitrate/sulfonate/bicarbonate transport system substrate-binding protein
MRSHPPEPGGPLTRRRFSVAAAALLGAAALPAAADAPATVTTQFLWIKNVEYAGFSIADADGLFRAQGIAPAFLAGGPNLASVEAIVAGGRADIGVDEFEKVVDAVSAGADFVVFGAVYQRGVAGILSPDRCSARATICARSERRSFATCAR